MADEDDDEEEGGPVGAATRYFTPAVRSDARVKHVSTSEEKQAWRDSFFDAVESTALTPRQTEAVATHRRERLTETPTEWSDYPKAGVAATGSALEGIGSVAQEALGRGKVSEWLKETGKGIRERAEGMQSEQFKFAQEEGVFGAKPGAAIAGLMSGSVPALIGTAGATALAATVGAPAAVATGVGAGVAALLGTGSVLDNLDKSFQKMTPAELAEISPAFKRNLDSGMSETEARDKFLTENASWYPYGAGLVSILTAKFGIEPMVAKVMTGKLVAQGVTRGFLLTGAGESGQESMENVAEDLATQAGKIKSGQQKDIDYGSLWRSFGEGIVLGAVTGGPMGAIAHRGGPARAPEHVPPGQVDSTTAAGLATATGQPPATPPAAPAGQAAPSARAPAAPGVGPREGLDAEEATTGDVEVTQAAQAAAKQRPPATPVPPAAPESPATLPDPYAADRDALRQRELEELRRQGRTTEEVLDEVRKRRTNPPTSASAGNTGQQDGTGTTPPQPGGVGAAGPVGAKPTLVEIDPAQTAALTGGAQPTIPEAPATLEAQRQQLVNGERSVVMYPQGTPPGPLPKGMAPVVIKGNVFHYDPNRITEAEIRQAALEGRENEILGLGPFNKADVMAAPGPEMVVAERTPDGTEVRAAAAKPATAPIQQAAMEQGATPGNIVATEPVAETIAGRIAPADTPVPSYIQENRAAAVDQANRTGMNQTIGEMARQGRTAAQISEALGGKMTADEVRAVRDSLGIQPAGPLMTPGGILPESERQVGPPAAPPAKKARKPKTPKTEKLVKKAKERAESEALPASPARVTERAQQMQQRRTELETAAAQYGTVTEKTRANIAQRVEQEFQEREKAATDEEKKAKGREAHARAEEGRQAVKQEMAKPGPSEVVRRAGEAEPQAEPKPARQPGRARAETRRDAAHEQIEEHVDQALRDQGVTEDLRSQAREDAASAIAKDIAGHSGSVNQMVKENQQKALEAAERSVERQREEQAKRDIETHEEAVARYERETKTQEETRGGKHIGQTEEAALASVRTTRWRTAKREIETAQAAGLPTPKWATDYMDKYEERKKLPKKSKIQYEGKSQELDAIWAEKAKAAGEQRRSVETAKREKPAADTKAAHELNEAVARRLSNQPAGIIGKTIAAIKERAAAIAEIAENEHQKKFGKPLPGTLAYDQPWSVNLGVLAKRVANARVTDSDFFRNFPSYEFLMRNHAQEAALNELILPSDAVAPAMSKAEKALGETIVEVSADTDQTTPGAMAQSLRYDDAIHAPTPAGKKPVNGEKGTYTGRQMMAKVLEDAKQGDQSKGLYKVFMNHLQTRLNDLVGNIEVHIVDDMAVQALRPKGMTADVGGLFRPMYGVSQFGVKPQIVLSNTRFWGATEADRRHIVMHEMTHAATSIAYNEDINGTRAAMDTLFAYAKDRLPEHYAFKNAKEFIAEAFTNEAFQRQLANLEAPPNFQRVGIKNAWQGLLAVVRNMLRAPRGAQYTSMLEAVVQTSDKGFVDLDRQVEELDWIRMERMQKAQPGMTSEDDPLGVGPNIVDTATRTLDAAKETLSKDGRAWARTKLLAAESTGSIQRRARDVFGGAQSAFEKWVDRYRAMGPEVDELRKAGDDIAVEFGQYERNNKPGADRASAVGHDATVVGADPRYDLDHPNNEHLKGRGFGKQRKRNEHARLQQEWAALDDEGRAIMSKAFDYYKDMQELMASTLASNIVDMRFKQPGANPNNAAKQDVVDWVMNGGIDKGPSRQNAYDKAMQKALGPEMVEHLKKVSALRKIKGVYLPLMRRGEFVFTSKIKIPPPPSGDAVQTGDATFVFDDEAKASTYLEGLPDGITTKKVRKFWVDPSNPAKPVPMDFSDDTVPRWLVDVQNQHVAFFDSMADATKARDAQKAAGTHDDVSDVSRRDNPAKIGQTELSNLQMLPLANAIEQSANLSTDQKAAMKQMVGELAIRYGAGSHIQQRSLMRKNVLGYSQNFRENIVDYNSSASNQIVRNRNVLEMQELEAQVNKFIESKRYSGDDQASVRRDEFRREMRERIHKDYEARTQFDDVVRHATTMSFMMHLASPTHSGLNAMQVEQVTLPELSGRHGLVQSQAAITRAYSAIGGLREAKEGIKATIAAAKGVTRAGDTAVQRIVDRAAQEPDGALLKRALGEVQKLGLLANDAGIEFEGQAQFSKHAFIRGLDYAARIARQMPQAIENINRAVTAIAAFRLEYARNGGDFDAAMTYVKDTVEATQGDYSARGTGRVFNNSAARLVLQFKKYPAMMTQLLARNISQAFRGESPQVKKEARRRLLTMGLVGMMTAGLTGAIPWEPAKALVLAAWMMGLSDDWDSLEAGVQKKVAQILGNFPAEVIMRGLPRIAGVDLSNRVGIDSLWLGMMPKGEKKADFSEWVLGMIGGAPTAAAMNAFSSLKPLVKGNFVEAASSAPLPKIATDFFKAVQGLRGKETATGIPLSSPYNYAEAAAKTLGLGTAKDARTFESGYARQKKDEKAMKAEGAKLKNEYARATPTKQQSIWREIQKHNATYPDDPITMGELRRYVRDFKKRYAEELEAVD
jgi:Large polyvalent protein associated domain 39